METPSENNDIKLDLEGIVSGEPVFNMPEAKIALARQVLAALFGLVLLNYIVSSIPDEYTPQKLAKLAEAVYQGVVPIASMVIGYYFAKD